MAPPVNNEKCEQCDVLLIDDQPDACEDILAALRKAGNRIYVCGGVHEALDLLERNRSERSLLARVKVVILDVMMPGHDSLGNHDAGMMSGVCLFDQVNRELPEAGIVFLTNSSSKDIQRRIPFDQLRIVYRQKFGTVSPRTRSHHERSRVPGNDLVSAIAGIKKMPKWISAIHGRLTSDAEELPPGSDEGDVMSIWFDFCRTIAWPSMPKPASCGIACSRLYLAWRIGEEGEIVELQIDSTRSIRLIRCGEIVAACEKTFSVELNVALHSSLAIM